MSSSQAQSVKFHLNPLRYPYLLDEHCIIGCTASLSKTDPNLRDGVALTTLIACDKKYVQFDDIDGGGQPSYRCWKDVFLIVSFADDYTHYPALQAGDACFALFPIGGGEFTTVYYPATIRRLPRPNGQQQVIVEYLDDDAHRDVVMPTSANIKCQDGVDGVISVHVPTVIHRMCAENTSIEFETSPTKSKTKTKTKSKAKNRLTHSAETLLPPPPPLETLIAAYKRNANINISIPQKRPRAAVESASDFSVRVQQPAVKKRKLNHGHTDAVAASVSGSTDGTESTCTGSAELVEAVDQSTTVTNSDSISMSMPSPNVDDDDTCDIVHTIEIQQEHELHEHEQQGHEQQGPHVDKIESQLKHLLLNEFNIGVQLAEKLKRAHAVQTQELNALQSEHSTLQVKYDACRLERSRMMERDVCARKLQRKAMMQLQQQVNDSKQQNEVLHKQLNALTSLASVAAADLQNKQQTIDDLLPHLLALKIYADDMDYGVGFDQQGLTCLEQKLEEKLKRVREAKHNLNLCVVCHDAEKSHAMVPCGHVCVCDACVEGFQVATDKCPVCRGNVSHVVHLFH